MNKQPSKQMSPAETSEEEVTEFQELYLKVYGIQLSRVEATEKAIKLLNLFEVIWRPIPEGQKKKEGGSERSV